jgi:hypothetical protein
LWSEIREVDTGLPVYDKASLNAPPAEFGNLGEDIREGGVYEVSRKDGSENYRQPVSARGNYFETGRGAL